MKMSSISEPQNIFKTIYNKLNYIVKKNKNITLYKTAGSFIEEQEVNEEVNFYLNVYSDEFEGMR